MRLLRWMPALAIVLPLAAMATPALAQSPPDSGAFVSRLGADTLTIERFVSSASRLESEAVFRSPETGIARLTVQFGADGRAERAEVTVHAAPDAPPTRGTVILFEGDSATVTTTQGGETRTRRVGAHPDAVPLLNPFYAPYDLILRRARAARGDSVVAHAVSGGGVDAYVVRRTAADSMVIRDETFGDRAARVDRAGRLLSFQAVGSPHGTIVERVPWPDLDAWAGRFTGRALGSLSPRDTVRATVRGAALLVDYSRPAKRGRVVFGGLVPWNEVWRTGANRATHLTTDRNLRVGDVTIPAGTYTLYTIPSQAGWKLILNRQTGQGGLTYDASQDLARFDLKVETAPEVVERFTIGIREEEPGGVLTLAWERVLASLAFRVAP